MLYDIKKLNNEIYIAIYSYEPNEYNALLQFNNTDYYFDNKIDIKNLENYLKKYFVKKIKKPILYNKDNQFLNDIDVLIIKCDYLEIKKNTNIRRTNIFNVNKFYKR